MDRRSRKNLITTTSQKIIDFELGKSHDDDVVEILSWVLTTIYNLIVNGDDDADNVACQINRKRKLRLDGGLLRSGHRVAVAFKTRPRWSSEHFLRKKVDNAVFLYMWIVWDLDVGR